MIYGFIAMDMTTLVLIRHGQGCCSEVNKFISNKLKWQMLLNHRVEKLEKNRDLVLKGKKFFNNL